MERWERERILGEWGVRDGTVRSEAERRALEEELEASPLRGRALPRRLRNFRPDAAGYVVSAGGPLAYMVRLRAIHDETAEHESRLDEAWHELARECADESEFARRWRLRAERWSFHAVNELIERHNRWYPIEARLPMDPKTGDYALVGGKPYRRRPLDADWVLERFPPVLGLARAAA
ncbi:MAG TPA: hypothetical protein VM290_01510 [Gaiellaceae bacterium]|nr:hypothetical protein [Gaiellaceae bacterium]